MVYIIISYFILIVGIGIYSRFQIKTPADFYIAGKKGGVMQVSGSLLATILGGSAILGTLELSQQNGWAAMWFLLCASAGLFILAPLSKYVSRFGQYTLPELLGTFYGKNAQLISSLIITVAWLGIIAAQIIGSAKILDSIGLLEYQQAAIISAVVFIAYTLVGGQKSILKTDLLQSVLIFMGIGFLFIVMQVNKTPIEPQEIKPLGLFHEGFSVLDLIILFLTYSTTFIVGPDIYSRIFCAKSEKSASKSVLLTAILLVPLAFVLTSVGLSTANQVSATEIGILTTGNEYLPEWAYGLLIAALLSAVMSSADTTLLTASMIGSNVINNDLNTWPGYGTTKMLIVMLGVLSMVIALYVTSIIQMLLMALAFFSGAFIVPTIAGLFQIKVRKPYVVIAMLIGGIIALSGKLINIYLDDIWGNGIIICSYLINLLILFMGFLKRNK